MATEPLKRPTAFGPLPGGVALASGETVIRHADLLVSNVLIYMRLRLVLTNRRLAGERPNTLFGVFPIGSHKISYPISSIAGVDITTSIVPGPLVIGLLLGFYSFGLGFRRGWFGLLLSALFLLYSYRATLVVTNSGGGTIKHRISVFNRSAAQEFATVANTTLAERGP